MDLPSSYLEPFCKEDYQDLYINYISPETRKCIDKNYQEALDILEGTIEGDYQDFLQCFFSIGKALGYEIDYKNIKDFRR